MPETEAPPAPAPEGAGTPAAAPEAGAGTPPAAAESVDYAKWIEDNGGLDTVKDAVAIHQALRTQEGVQSLFVEAGKALGLDEGKVQGLFAPAVEAEVEKAEDDLDRPVTARELQAIQQKVAEDLAANDLSTKQAGAKSIIDTALGDLKVTDARERQIVLELGSSFLADNDWDPDHIKDAVRRGHDEFKRLVQDQGEKYLAEKVKAKEESPSPLKGGSTPGGENYEPPSSLEEAKARVRARMNADGSFK